MEFILVTVDCDREGRPLVVQRTESLGRLIASSLSGCRCGFCSAESTAQNAIYLGDTVELCEQCLRRSGQNLLEPIRLSLIVAK